MSKKLGMYQEQNKFRKYQQLKLIIFLINCKNMRIGMALYINENTVYLSISRT